MAEAGRRFGGATAGVVAASAEHAASSSLALELRETRVRLTGEILVFVALLVLLAGLVAWRQISGFDFIRNGWIDVPSHVAVAWKFSFPDIANVVPGEYDRSPYAAQAFSTLLWFMAFSALLRRRHVLVCLLFGFCMVPWALLGVSLGGLGFISGMILVFHLVSAFRRRDMRKAGMFLAGLVAVSVYLSLDALKEPTYERRPAIRFAVVSTPGGLKQSKMSETPQAGEKPGRLASTMALDWPESLAGEKAYLVAQDAFFRGETDVVAANLARARVALAGNAYAAKRLAGLDMYLLSRNIGAPDAVDAYRSRHDRMTMLAYGLFGVASLLAIIGLSIERLARLMSERVTRLAGLRTRVRATGGQPVSATARRAASGSDDVVVESRRRIRQRIVWALGLASPFVIGAAVVAVLAFYLRVPAAGTSDAFSTVHMLAPLFDNFPDGYENGAAKRNALVAPTLWPYYLAVVAIIVAFAMRKFRAAAIVVIVMIATVHLTLYVFPRAGQIEIAARDFKPGTIGALQRASAGEISADPSLGRTLEAYQYGLAQLSYLAGNPQQTALYLKGVGPLDHWDYPSVEWRMALMQEWTAVNGFPVTRPASASGFVMPEEGRLLEGKLWSAAMLLTLLALPGLVVALINLWRQRRIDLLVDNFLRMSAARRATKAPVSAVPAE